MLGTVIKQPADVLDYDIDFERWLTDGDALSSAVAVVDDDGLTIDDVTVIGTVVKVWVSGGEDGATYKITATATTNDGRVKEEDFRIRVRNF